MHRNNAFFIGLFCLCNSLFGMDREQYLHNAIVRETIPVLALNNYLVNVSTAYKALQKEAHLEYVAFKNIRYNAREAIQTINESNRTYVKKSGLPFYSAGHENTCNRFCNIRQDICIHRIGITYTSPSNQPGNYNACITIDSFLYHISHSRVRYQRLPSTLYCIHNIASSLKKKVGHLLQQGECTCIEVPSYNNLSSWIKITNHCTPDEYDNATGH